MRKKLTTIFIAVFTTSVTMAQTTPEAPKWVAKCKPLENAIEDVAKSKRYDEKALTRIFQLNKQLSTCDDGYYGEGISDVTVKALAQDYKSVVKTASQDKEMLAFVLKHIDATTDWHDLDSVVQNSVHQCAKEIKDICIKVEKVAKAASKEAQSAGK